MSAKVTLPSGVSRTLDMIPTEPSKLAFVCAFLTDVQMRRLLRGAESAAICKELDLPITKSEATNCRAIAAYYKGE